MNNNFLHKQIYVKVNTPVDEGVAELIEALSLFPKLKTSESCEEDSPGKAWVSFYYGDYWDNAWSELSDFLFGYFSPKMNNYFNDDIDIVIRATEFSGARAEIFVPQHLIDSVAKKIRELAANYQS